MKYNYLNKSYIEFGDCLELMKDIPDESVDMVLCDLPYAVTQNEKDIALPFDKLWEQYERITKQDSNIVLFGQGLFLIDLVNSNRKMFKYELIWDKQLASGHLNAKRQPLRQHENIAVFYKKLGTYNPQMTIGKPSHSQGTKFKTKEVTNQNYGKHKPVETDTTTNLKYPKSIISFQKPHPSSAVHRTEKSIDLLEWLIKTYSNEGDLVLDNTAGSFTTAIACLNTNREFISFEMDSHYFELGKKRIEDRLNEVNRGLF
jgi:site-specific DNA-methyltransferase (adenine-specific)